MKNPGDGLLEYALFRSDEELCQEALEAIRHWRDHAVVGWDLAEELGTLLRRLMVSVETVVEHPTEAELCKYLPMAFLLELQQVARQHCLLELLGNLGLTLVCLTIAHHRAFNFQSISVE